MTIRRGHPRYGLRAASVLTCVVCMAYGEIVEDAATEDFSPRPSPSAGCATSSADILSP